MIQECRVLKKGKCEVSNSYYTGHLGIDLVGANYTLDEVVAHSDGIVTNVVSNINENTSGDARYGSSRVSHIYGNYVKIRHNNGMYTLYAHLKYGSLKVNVGESVTKGKVLGFMGNTGYSFGAHLHFEVRDKNNNVLNPTKYVYGELDGNDEIKKYIKGDYICGYDMKVRSGPGLNYTVKKVSELTADGKRNATTSNIYAYAVYKKGTIFTALSIFEEDDGVWARTPSGYVCIRDTQTLYCSKV